MSRLLIVTLALCFILVACSAPGSSESADAGSTDLSSSKSEQVSGSSDSEPSDLQSSSPTTDVTVLKSATVPLGEHDTSGMFEFLSDGTVKITDFNYDGAAPDVYIALGDYDDEGNFVYGELATEKIDGAYENEDVMYELESGVDVEKYSAVSIWCHNFTEDFSSAQFK